MGDGVNQQTWQKNHEGVVSFFQSIILPWNPRYIHTNHLQNVINQYRSFISNSCVVYFSHALGYPLPSQTHQTLRMQKDAIHICRGNIVFTLALFYIILCQSDRPSASGEKSFRPHWPVIS